MGIAQYKNAAKPLRTRGIDTTNQHFLMKPSYYKDYSLYNFTYDPDAVPVQNIRDYDSLPASGSNYSFPSFEIKGNNSTSDVRYEMAMNNFIAESTKFFIKGEKLSSFSATRPEGQGYLFSDAKTYYMDVVMSKDSAFNPVNSPGSLGGRYFGPPVAYTKPSQEFFNSRDKISDLSYLPYTPPYFFGEQVARISFSPTASGLHSLDDILENLVIDEFVTEDTQRFYAAILSRLGRGTDPETGDPKIETTRDKLRDFYNSKIVELKSTLAEVNKNVKDKATQIKIQEVAKYLVELNKTAKVSNDNLVDLLQYFELVKEIKVANAVQV